MLSRTQAGPGRTVKQEQEEISRNHVHTFIYLSVCVLTNQILHPQSLSGENNNQQRLSGKLPSLNGGPKSGNSVAGLSGEKAADRERAALLPSVSGGGGGGGGGDGKASC